MRLALFEPDIPQNTGTLIRLGACLGVAHPILSLAPKHIDQLGQLPKLPSGILPASEMASKMPRI